MTTRSGVHQSARAAACRPIGPPRRALTVRTKPSLIEGLSGIRWTTDPSASARGPGSFVPGALVLGALVLGALVLGGVVLGAPAPGALGPGEEPRTSDISLRRRLDRWRRRHPHYRPAC